MPCIMQIMEPPTLPDITSPEWKSAVATLSDEQVIAAIAQRIRRLSALRPDIDRWQAEIKTLDAGPDDAVSVEQLHQHLDLLAKSAMQRVAMDRLRIEMESLILHVMYPDVD